MSRNRNARNKVILQYHDARVCQSDLRLLDEPTAWLNDACVHFGLVRLQLWHRQRRCRTTWQRAQSSSQSKDKRRCEGGGEAAVPSSPPPSPSAIFVDPAVVSFLTHQCEDEEDMMDLYRGLHVDNDNGVSNGNGNINDDSDDAASDAASDSPCKRRRKRCSFYFVPVNDNNAASREGFRRPGGGSHWSLLLVVAVATAAPVAPPTAECRNGIEQNVPCSSGREEFSPVRLLCLHFDSSRGSNALAAHAVATKFRDVLLLGGGISGRSPRPSVRRPISPSAPSSASISASVVECRSPQQGNGHDCGLYALAAAEALSSGLPSLHGELYPIAVLGDEELVRRAFVDRCECVLNEALSGGDFAPALRRRMAEDVRSLAAASAVGER